MVLSRQHLFFIMIHLSFRYLLKEQINEFRKIPALDVCLSCNYTCNTKVYLITSGDDGACGGLNKNELPRSSWLEVNKIVPLTH